MKIKMQKRILKEQVQFLIILNKRKIYLNNYCLKAEEIVQKVINWKDRIYKEKEGNIKNCYEIFEKIKEMEKENCERKIKEKPKRKKEYEAAYECNMEEWEEYKNKIEGKKKKEGKEEGKENRF